MEKRVLQTALFIADREDALEEMRRGLQAVCADIYVFPEGFIRTEEALSRVTELMAQSKKTVIAGYLEHAGETLYESALVFEKGRLCGKYRKTALTAQEREKGKGPGEKIHCIETSTFRVGIPICYEIHFPEVVRIMALQNPAFLVNPIGTGMFDEHQLAEWLTIAKARAIENQTYVLGCSGCRGEIPLAYAVSPLGDVTGFTRGRPEYLLAEIDLDFGKKYRYMDDRTPLLYKKLAE